jgi:hypothetical protein
MALDDSSGNVLGGLLGAAGSAATGNPLGVGLALGGIGLSLFGGMSKASSAGEMAGVQQKMTQIEMQQDTVRQRAMELSARRQHIEVLRNAQRARSLALNAATTQGAQSGSGLQGGYGQIQGAANWNIAGINQNLDFGEQMFGLNQILSQQKIEMARLQGQSATAGAYQSLGGTLLQAAPTVGKLSKGFFGGSGNAQPTSAGYNPAPTDPQATFGLY